MPICPCIKHEDDEDRISCINKPIEGFVRDLLSKINTTIDQYKNKTGRGKRKVQLSKY